MASIDKRPNGQWRARWREYPGGPQTTKTFARKVDAQQHLIDVQHRLMTSTYIPPDRQKTSVREFCAVWLERQSWRPRTRLTATGIMDNHFLPRFGERPLGAVRRGDLEAWAAGLSLSPATVRLAMQYVGSLFGAAVTDGFLNVNPVTGAKTPRVDRVPVVPPTVEEIWALQAAAPGWFAIAVTLGGGAGLRQGEAAGLTIDRVATLRRQLTVDRQLSPIVSKGEPVELGVPKTDRSYRTVPLAGFVVDAIAEHVEEYGTGTYGLVLHHNGEPIRRATFGKFWRQTREKAGLETRFHDCRHFFASTLLSQGVPVAATADYLGHSAAVLLSTYAHLIPEDHDRARGAVEAAFQTVASEARAV